MNVMLLSAVLNFVFALRNGGLTVIGYQKLSVQLFIRGLRL